MPADRLPVKAYASRQWASLDREPTGRQEVIGASRPSGRFAPLLTLEVSKWLVHPIVPLHFDSLILLLSAGSFVLGAASGSPYPAMSGRCSRPPLTLVQSVQKCLKIWHLLASCLAAGWWCASSSGNPAESAKKEPRKAAPLRLDTISNISRTQTTEKARPRLEKQAVRGVEKMA